MTGLLAVAAPSAHAGIFGTDPLAISFNALSGTPNGPSAHPTVSGDNRKTRYAAFDSTATNLVAGDTNGQPDVYLWTRPSGVPGLQLDKPGGTLRRVTARAASASLTFTGRSVAWVAPTGLTRGSAKVYIDGSYVATISLYRPAAARQVVFAKRFASARSHTIRIRVSGTWGHPRVDLDAFAYLN